MMRRSTRDDRGAVAIIIALTTVVMIGVLAFVTDFGMAYSNKRVMQNGADAAALAAAQEIALNAPTGLPCAVLEPLWEPRARQVAEDYFRQNVPNTAAALATGTAGIDVQCDPTLGMTVRVVASQQSPTFFGGIFGVDAVPVGVSAEAVLGPPGKVIGLRPFAMCLTDANALSAAPTFSYNLVFDNNTDRGCGESSGNVGLLDLDGASNGKSQLPDWIRDGFDGSTSLSNPPVIEGKPGDTGGGALDTEMQSVIGKEIVLPVYDTVEGNGANARYNVTAFIAVEVCQFQFGSKTGTPAPATAVRPCRFLTKTPTSRCVTSAPS